MRIVGGQWRGRRVSAPAGTGTRPTADRVREALFSILESRFGRLEGASVLDAFAGSGALGLEALSRGAAACTFVEVDRAAERVLRANIAQCGAGELASVVRGDAATLAAAGRLPGAPFGLLLADPPYRIGAAVVPVLLSALARSGQLIAGAAIAWEHPAGTAAEWPAGFEAVTGKRYGSAAVDIARWTGGAAS